MREARTRELVDLCHHLHARGWVANHDGNVSCRIEGGFLASPSAVSKGEVGAEMVLRLDGDGKVVEGTRKVFGELPLHAAAWRARPDAGWVVHAHPPHATAWAVAGRSFWEAPFLAEAVVSLGVELPLVEASEVQGALGRADALLLAGHGVLVVGPDATTARLRLELVEHLARVAALAQPLGGTRGLPHAELERLLEARTRAGLGRPAAGAAGEPRPDVRALVSDALKRLG